MTGPAQTLKATIPARICHRSTATRTRLQVTLLPAVMLGLTLLPSSAALASGNEAWASETIEHMRHQTIDVAAASRPRGRRSAVERLHTFMVEEEQVRPRQHARRHDRTEEYHSSRRTRTHREGGRKLASLNRSAAPAPATQPSIALDAKSEAAAPTPVPSNARAVASLGTAPVEPAPTPQAPPSAGPINWVASANCLASPLRAILAEVAALFGTVRVNSTCRSKAHNARVGGASRSYHLTGQAVDFRIAGNPKAVSQFLLGKKTVGGFKHYGFGVFHIDTGPRRTWASARRGRRS
jgi:Peptidase M15